MLRLEAFSRVLEIIKEVVDLLLVDLQIRAIDLQLQSGLPGTSFYSNSLHL